MTIMESKPEIGSKQVSPQSGDEKTESKAETPDAAAGNVVEPDENAFSNENLAKDTEVPSGDTSSGYVIGLGGMPKPVVLTAQDKISFIDSIANNSRFMRKYSLFGGRVSFTLRSLTSEELQALSAWIVKNGTSTPDFQITGRYRKYLMAAQIAMYNGIEMPPLEAPLFETLESDGKTVRQPGWISRSSFWDDKPSGLVDAIISCMRDFDARYSTLCKKAEDSNFWNPDTP